MDSLGKTSSLWVDPRVKSRIVLCGSMSFYAEILRVQADLFAAGVRSIVPEPEDEIRPLLNNEDFERFKRSVSFAYLRKIRDPRTFGVLAVNLDKYGIPNYIGPNTFAEIAVAFAQSKRIYLYGGAPDVYSDELSAWNALALRGDLKKIVHDYRENQRDLGDQLPLFTMTTDGHE